MTTTIVTVGPDDEAWARHDFYMQLATAVEVGAKCRGSNVGSVVIKERRVLGAGYNGTPAGFPNCDETERGCERCGVRYERPDLDLSGRLYDICLCVHAEQNVMATAARFGVSIGGSTLYTTVQPCFTCFKELIQVGIREVYFRRTWRFEHPEYQWVASDYERLVDHYRDDGCSIEQLLPLGTEPESVLADLGGPDRS